ncbi:family 10 glycosylhydrolase [Cytophaga sp. FL35]|uniref:glycoside hydrolase family 10 protein n=1 Tax=Cytophaga sp. FL35 TaxID=1904456 RepID=UPI001CA3F306|nr:family 10 glycosylhydrolase [Cytophaga sp. FL35]
MKGVKQLLLITCILFGLQAFAQNQKGFWLTNVASEALDTKEGIMEVVQNCKKFGMDHIYVVVWNRGYTLYPSSVMKNRFGVEIMPRFAKRDFLKELIHEAHKNQMKVHAWFEFGFSSSYKQEDGGPILEAKPEWKALNYDGKLVSKNGFQWMNAFDPEVQDFVLSLITEVIDTYDIDGIQGDDRLPANPSTAGYDPYTIALYKEEHNGKLPPKDYKDPDWIDWRATKLDSFAERIYKTVKAKDSNVTVSMAPSIYPWSKEEYLQNWPTWLKNGWVDYIIPQVYRYDLDAYTATIKSNLEFVPEELKEKFIPGVLLKVDDYVPSESFLEGMIQTNRKLGLDSEVFFFYEGLKDHYQFFQTIYPKL